MSNPAQARVQRGVPTGGEYAATVHAEPSVSLAPVRRPELAGWPESLPEPEVSLNLNEDGSLTTQVHFGEDPVFEAWSSDDDVHDIESSGWVHDSLTDDETREQAEEWVRGKHAEMAEQMRRDLKAAFDANRARVLMAATGKPQAALTDEELAAHVDVCFKSSQSAVAEGERASVALFARRVLEDHPGAHSAALSVMEHEAGTSYTGFTVFDEAGNVVGTNDRDFGEEDGGVWDVAFNLETDSWAWDAFAPKTGHGGHGPSVDLQRAASWAPGTDPRTGEAAR